MAPQTTPADRMRRNGVLEYTAAEKSILPSGLIHCPYVVLGLRQPGCYYDVDTATSLHKARRNALLKLHPDKNVNLSVDVAALNTEIYLQIKPSFDFLSDVDKKAKYDRALSKLKADEQKKAKKAKREEKKLRGGGKRGARMVRENSRGTNNNRINGAKEAKH